MALQATKKRWERDYKHAIYRVPAKKLVKGALALHKAIGLGIDDSNGESFVGTTEGVSIRVLPTERLYINK